MSNTVIPLQTGPSMEIDYRINQMQMELMMDKEWLRTLSIHLKASLEATQRVLELVDEMNENR